MSMHDQRPQPDEDRDLLDSIPGFERMSTSLQRSFGPSCLLSLIIAALIFIVLRRYIRLPLPGMVILLFGVWWAVLVVLVRLGGAFQDDEDF
jgi:hypothetical protein